MERAINERIVIVSKIALDSGHEEHSKGTCLLSNFQSHWKTYVNRRKILTHDWSINDFRPLDTGEMFWCNLYGRCRNLSFKLLYTEKIYNEINKKVLQEVCAIRQKKLKIR